MARASRRSLSRSAVAAYLCICVALLLLLGLTIWGSYRDIRALRATLLEAEIGRLRSHAERTVGRIEQEFEIEGTTPLDNLEHDGWLRRHWERDIQQDERRLYAAIISNKGKVILHSDVSRAGESLRGNWYNRVLFEVGEDVVETDSPALTSGELAYEVNVPIEVDGGEVADYHAGFAVDWFEQWTSDKQNAFLRRRALLTGGVLLIVALATTSLYYIASHSITLRRAVDSASVNRATEVGKLAAGLAHEIRNPLHAIQLNLHSFRRAQQREAGLPPGEIAKMLDQSIREIERIEHLMQQLVGFATPDEPGSEVINVASEIQEVVEFIRQEMLDMGVCLDAQLSSSPVWVQIDQGRLRQIMLNLLQNAQQAMDGSGRIVVGLARRRGRVELEIADDGPGIAAEDLDRIFEPFYSTKSDGSGLGLALVKRFIDEIDGEIRCEPNMPKGVTFRITLREARPPRKA